MYPNEEKNIGEYVRRVLMLLKKRLKTEEHIPSSRIRQEFRYEKEHKGRLVFDLVVFAENGKGIGRTSRIERIFEIKTPAAIQRSGNWLISRLLEWKKVFHAKEVSLVFLQDENLRIVPVEAYQKSYELEALLPNIHEEEGRMYASAESISDFISTIKESCLNQELQGIRCYFRGHADRSYRCVPGIYRVSKDGLDLSSRENQLFHEAIVNSPKEYPDIMGTFDKLVKMQHYGLPTRLLDVTANPLIALYFACCGRGDVDGEVLVFKTLQEDRKFFDSDLVCILSNIAKQRPDFDFNNAKDREHLVYDVQQERIAFEDFINPKDVGRTVFVQAKLNNERIARQMGAFVLFGIDGKKPMPSTFPFKYEKIRIPRGVKAGMLTDLALLGISEATLFPEEEHKLKNLVVG